MNYDIRNVLSDKKKLSIIAGVTVVGLSIGSIGLKVHKEKVNPSTPPVSAGEIDSKDKMISQLKTENKKLDAQKTKSNNSSNELVPYNLNGRLGGRYNSIPLDYSSTPLDLHEPTVYEPTLEPVEDEIIEETDTPTVEPIVNEVVAPPVTPPTVTNEQGIGEPAINEASKFDVTTATYKGRNIVKHLPNMTYDVINTDNNVIIKVTGTNIQIEFTRVNNNEFNCTKLVKDGQELTGIDRDKVLNEIFEINEGESNNHVVIPPEPTIPGPTIPDPSLDKPVEEPTPEQPKEDDKVEEDNVINPDNTSVTAPPTQQEVEIG